MVIGLKDSIKLFGISVIACCAVFVCTLFLNYNTDIVGIKNQITTEAGMIMYDAQVLTGRTVSAVSGGCLVITSVIMLLSYVKNYIDTHGKELGILKALGYSNIRAAGNFWVFGVSVLAGCVLGFLGAFLYMPVFYERQNQNAEKLLPEFPVRFHLGLAVWMIVVPALFFAALSVLYAFLKMRRPVLKLLREIQEDKEKISRKETKDLPFLQDLKKNTLRGRKILVFFIVFSAFCFSAMTQMSMVMDKLADGSFAWLMLLIGLVLAFMTLFLALTSVVKAGTKTIAMMKVFGYSKKQCSRAILGGYRPVSYVGFAIGTAYQYILLKIVVTVIFDDFENMQEYSFDFKNCAVSLLVFIVAYELIMYCYSLRLDKLSAKNIMLE